MPLPFAHPPKESKVYKDLKNLKITGVTVDQLDTLKGVLFAQGVEGSEDEMRRLSLLGGVSSKASSSGPIPGTAQLIATTGISNSLTTVFQPESNQVWQLYAVSISTLDGASSMILKLYDGTTQVVIDSGTSTSGAMELNEPVCITSDAYLVVRTSNASSGDAQLAAAVVRIR